MQALRPCDLIFKQKIMTFHAMIFLFGRNQRLGGGFTHRLDALGAKHFMHFLSFFHYQGLLQVRFELAVGSPL
jgi:hypothetical protein